MLILAKGMASLFFELKTLPCIETFWAFRANPEKNKINNMQFHIFMLIIQI